MLSWEQRYAARERAARIRRAVRIASWIVAAGVLAYFISQAHATWKPEYASAPAQVREWYQAATLTPEAAKRLGFYGCCDASDIVHTRFRLDTKTGSPHWLYERDGAWQAIPDDIVHWNEQAPDNMPTLFALAHNFEGVPAGTLTCFYPPGGGS